jgi:hypothetical protein
MIVAHLIRGRSRSGNESNGGVLLRSRAADSMVDRTNYLSWIGGYFCHRDTRASDGDFGHGTESSSAISSALFVLELALKTRPCCARS